MKIYCHKFVIEKLIFLKINCWSILYNNDFNIEGINSYIEY